MAVPFSSENTMIDPLILRLETYPQAGRLARLRPPHQEKEYSGREQS
jgi:hypothetical protein